MTRSELEAMSVEECWSLLPDSSVGRIAVAIKNKPDIFPVNYRVDGSSLVVKTAPGLKLAAATLGSGIAFEVDELDQMTQTGWSIVIKGRAIEIQTVDELLDADSLEIEPWAAGAKNRYFRLLPDDITGRRIALLGDGARGTALS